MLVNVLTAFNIFLQIEESAILLNIFFTPAIIPLDVAASELARYLPTYLPGLVFLVTYLPIYSLAFVVLRNLPLYSAALAIALFTAFPTPVAVDVAFNAPLAADVVNPATPLILLPIPGLRIFAADFTALVPTPEAILLGAPPASPFKKPLPTALAPLESIESVVFHLPCPSL